MDQFISLGYSAAQLKMLNQCRIYIRVIFLSDIICADGKLIILQCKNGSRVVDRTSTLNWPLQATPSRSVWILWKQALGHFEHKAKLIQPLTSWLAPSHQCWTWFTSPSMRYLYKYQTGNRWLRYFPSIRRSARTRLQNATYNRTQAPRQTEIPSAPIPVTVTTVGNIMTISPGHPLLPHRAPVVIPSWFYHLSTLQNTLQEHCNRSGNLHLFLAAH